MDWELITDHLIDCIRIIPKPNPHSVPADISKKSEQSRKSQIIYQILTEVMNKRSAGSKDSFYDANDYKCFGNMYYALKYPICWFRSFSFILFMDETFRNILIQGLPGSIITTPTSDKIQNLQSFILQVAHYFKTNYKNNVEGQFELQDWTKLFYLTSYRAVNSHNVFNGQITLDHVLLYFIQLLHEYKPTDFWCNVIIGGQGDVYAEKFFRLVWPQITKPECHQHIIRVVKQEKDLIYTFEANNGIHDPKIILLYYKGPLNVLNAKNRKTVLFAIHNNNVYTLSSMIMTSYLNWAVIKARGGHQFGIYKCKRKFYSEKKI